MRRRGIATPFFYFQKNEKKGAAFPPYPINGMGLHATIFMKAVVMAGGEGSRLRPLTIRRPKPMVPIAGKPVMEHILNLLKRHGITEVVVTVQYLAL